MIYKVQYWDEDEEIWIEDGLDMCHADTLCEECKKDRNHIDNCDYIHREVKDKQIALDKLESLRTEGVKARLIQQRKG